MSTSMSHTHTHGKTVRDPKKDVGRFEMFSETLSTLC